MLPLGRGHYTDWELRKSVEGKTLLKSRCTAMNDEFGVPKTTIQRYLNIIFMPLNFSSLKHHWYLMILGKINDKSVRKTISEKIVKRKLGQQTYILKDKEGYIVATS